MLNHVLDHRIFPEFSLEISGFSIGSLRTNFRQVATRPGSKDLGVIRMLHLAIAVKAARKEKPRNEMQVVDIP